jgi:hypothetical protein
MRGQTIIPDEPLGLPDGTPMTVTFHPTAAPISEEDRAALEEVYRERGCGGECDC